MSSSKPKPLLSPLIFGQDLPTVEPHYCQLWNRPKNCRFSTVRFFDGVKYVAMVAVRFQPGPGTKQRIWNRCYYWIWNKILDNILPCSSLLKSDCESLIQLVSSHCRRKVSCLELRPEEETSLDLGTMIPSLPASVSRMTLSISDNTFFTW